MKISVVSSGDLPSSWAHSINVAKHADGFKKIGFEVSILSPLRSLDVNCINKAKNINNFYAIDKGIVVKLFKDKSLFYWSGCGFIGRFISFLKFLSFGQLPYFFDPEKKIADFIVKNNFDLSYCRSYRASYYLIKMKFPTVVEIHSPVIKNKELKKLLKLKDSKYFLGISTISEKIKEVFVNYGVPSEKILVQEDAVDVEKFDGVSLSKKFLRKKIDLPIDKKIVTYCGSLRAGKGVNDLIKLAVTCKDKEAVLFVVVGGPEDRRKLFKNKCDRENIKNIKFLGFVDHNLVPLYLKSSDVLIMLYNSNEKNTVMDLNTTSPIKLFEYMASGVPVIATRIEPLEKVVVHNKEVVFVEQEDYKGAATQIDNLILNKVYAHSLAQCAYNKSQNFTYSKRCKNIVNFFYEEN